MTATANTPASHGKLTRDDLESKFRELQGDANEQVEEAKGYAVTAAIAVGIVVVAAVFVLGRRKGRRRSTVVEIRRI
jgi:hypothetical protein